MPWIILTIAGLFEIAWAVALKYSHGWSRLTPSIIAVVCMLISFVLLARAMKDLPAGTSYATWTGIGTVGVAILGIVLFKEPATALRLVFIGLIVGGIIGLKATAGSEDEKTTEESVAEPVSASGSARQP